MGLFSGILQGLGGILGDVIGAKQNAHSIAHATNQQIAGINKGIGEQQQQIATTRADEAPYMGFGTSSLGQLGDLLGFNGSDAASRAMAALKDSPMFSSLFNTGQEAILQNASATGGIRGGNTQGALADFGRDTMSKVVTDQIARLLGGAALGQTAVGQTDTLGQHGADAISSGFTSIGNAMSNKTTGQQQVYNNLGSQIQQLIASFATGGGF